MQPDRSEIDQRGTLESWTWLVWFGLVVALGLRPLIDPATHTVVPIYEQAAQDWLAGSEMYGLENRRPGLDQFRYAPAFAVAMVPFACLPFALGDVMWRLLGGWIFLAGFQSFTREFLPRSTSAQRAGLLWLLLPLSVGSLHNGQVNVHMVGLLLLTMTAVARQRWNLTTICLTVSIFCKLYPVALALLLVVLFPRPLAWRLSLGLGAGLGVPFLTQEPGYVAGEYGHWLAMLGFDDRRELPLGLGYRDLDMLLRWCGLVLTRTEYLGVQLLPALGLALLAWAGKSGHLAPNVHLRLVFDLTCCWMILLGPATESCTYILLAPTLACALLERHGPNQAADVALLGTALTLFVISVLGTGLNLNKAWMGVAQIVAAILLCLARLETLTHFLRGRDEAYAQFAR